MCKLCIFQLCECSWSKVFSYFSESRGVAVPPTGKDLQLKSNTDKVNQVFVSLFGFSVSFGVGVFSLRHQTHMIIQRNSRNEQKEAWKRCTSKLLHHHATFNLGCASVLSSPSAHEPLSDWLHHVHLMSECEYSPSLFYFLLPAARWWCWWTPWRIPTTSCVPTAPGRRRTCLTWPLTTRPARWVHVPFKSECFFIRESCESDPLTSCAGGSLPSDNQRADRGADFRLQCHRVCLRTHR